MTASAFGTHEIDVQDVEYLRHGDTPLLARIFKPRGGGPFPLVVSIHGGAWIRGDRLGDTPIHEPLARSGVVVASVDFRMPPDAGYPASMTDINYAIRWLKTRAAELGTRADMVGVMGTSSGGQQAMLLGMRPHDPRYAALPLPAVAGTADATVRCAILLWPVIDPLSRYRFARKLKEGGKPYPDVVDRVLPGHDQYWKTEEAMAEGSPVVILERGERVEMPPALYLQGAADTAHPRPDLDRFVAAYRKAGGQVELELYEGEVEGFLRNQASPNGRRGMERLIEFVHKTLG
ncbi:MAG: alpha/beta hydrolase [Candidatus Rokuibacteriota bacterium]